MVELKNDLSIIAKKFVSIIICNFFHYYYFSFSSFLPFIHLFLIFLSFFSSFAKRNKFTHRRNGGNWRKKIIIESACACNFQTHNFTKKKKKWTPVERKRRKSPFLIYSISPPTLHPPIQQQNNGTGKEENERYEGLLHYFVQSASCLW